MPVPRGLSPLLIDSICSAVIRSFIFNWAVIEGNRVEWKENQNWLLVKDTKNGKLCLVFAASKVSKQAGKQASRHRSK